MHKDKRRPEKPVTTHIRIDIAEIMQQISKNFPEVVTPEFVLFAFVRNVLRQAEKIAIALFAIANPKQIVAKFRSKFARKFIASSPFY